MVRRRIKIRNENLYTEEFLVKQNVKKLQLFCHICRNVRGLTRNPAIPRVGRRCRLYPKPSVQLPVAERKRLSRMTAVPYTYGDAVISNATINAR